MTSVAAINLGVSAETLKVVLRHRDFATTEKFYGAIRSAQSAAREVCGKMPPSCDSSALVGGLVGGLGSRSRRVAGGRTRTGGRRGGGASYYLGAAGLVTT